MHGGLANSSPSTCWNQYMLRPLHKPLKGTYEFQRRERGALGIRSVIWRRARHCFSIISRIRSRFVIVCITMRRLCSGARLHGRVSGRVVSERFKGGSLRTIETASGSLWSWQTRRSTSRSTHPSAAGAFAVELADL